MPKQTEERADENNGEAKPLPERLPRPTVWPATLALGTTLLAFGIVTSWIMSVAGLVLFLLGAGGWFEDLRNERV